MFIGMDVPAVDASSPLLQGLWFVLIGVLWVGFFFLEGFDFGIGMLIPFIGGKSDAKRRVMVNTIGPTWDGNEVWLLTAGGATFAAFPTWYATLFSVLYLPLFLVLVGLIIRGISFEYRSLNPSTKWRFVFDWCNTIGSFVVTLVLGVGFANFVRGIPGNPEYLTSFMHRFLGLFNGYGLLGGVMLVVLFLAHGSQFLSIKSRDEVSASARKVANVLTPVAAVLMAAFVVWGTMFYATDNPWTGAWGVPARWAVGILSVVCLIAASILGRKGRPGLAFIGSGLAIGTWVINVWVTIYGTLGIGAVADPAKLFFQKITFAPAGEISTMSLFASSQMTLGLMRTFAFIMVPIVLVYICWTYWIFRKRLNTVNIPVGNGISQTSVDKSNEEAS